MHARSLCLFWVSSCLPYHLMTLKSSLPSLVSLNTMLPSTQPISFLDPSCKFLPSTRSYLVLHVHVSSLCCRTTCPRNRATSRLNNPHSSSSSNAKHHGCSITFSIVIRESTSRSNMARIKSMLSSLMTYGTRRSRSMISSML